MSPIEQHRPRPLLLLVQDLVDGGGMETVLRRQLDVLARHHDVHVVAYTVPDELQAIVGWTPVRRFPGPGWLRTLWYALVVSCRLPGLRRRLATAAGAKPIVWATGGLVLNRVDVITVHFLHRGFVAEHGWAPGHRGGRRLNAAWARLIGLALESWSYRVNRRARFAAVTTAVAEDFAQHFPGRSCTVTPNGVEISTSVPRSDQVPVPLRAVFVGGDWARKGLPTVLEAVARTPGLRLVVVGDGPAQTGPVAASGLGIADRVDFVGWQSQVVPFLEAADVFVYPSRYETFGLAVFEAAGAGLAVVATPVGAIPELVADGRTGILVPVDDVAALAHALHRLVDDPLLVRRLGEAARQRAAAFSWENSVASVDRLLYGAATGGGR